MNLVIGGWISYSPSVECIVGWTTRKTLPFCFSPISIMSCLCGKDIRLSLRYIFALRESLGRRLYSESSYDLVCGALCVVYLWLLLLECLWDMHNYSRAARHSQAFDTSVIRTKVNHVRSDSSEARSNECWFYQQPLFVSCQSSLTNSNAPPPPLYTHSFLNDHPFLVGDFIVLAHAA